MKVRQMRITNGRFMVIGEEENGSVLMMSLECFTEHFEPIGENLYRQRRKDDKVSLRAVLRRKRQDQGVIDIVP